MIEEAAIRRQITLLGAGQDFDRSQFIAEKYFRKHGKSVYSGYFAKQFSMASSSFSFSNGNDRLERLKAAIEVLQEQSRRLSVYLLLAENAIGLGNVALAKFAAEHSQSLSDPASSERLRADLYLAAADVASEDAATAIAVLEGIPNSALKTSDAALRDLALEVGNAVAREPTTVNERQASLEVSAATTGRDVNANAENNVSGTDPVEEAARKAIGSAEKMLRGDFKWKAQ